MPSKAEIILVAAVAENGCIGKDNHLLWNLPDDLKRFVNLTRKHTVLMGRKTFDSLYIKPLPHRKNIVITKDASFSFQHPDVFIFSDLSSAINNALSGNEKIYIIGGGEIYRQTIDLANKLEITLVHDRPQGDTQFPAINKDEWELVASEPHPVDKSHAVAFTYLTYKRKNDIQ